MGHNVENDFQESVKAYYKHLGDCTPLSREEELQLILKAKDGDIEARNKVVSANLRFVFDVAAKYKGLGLEIGELIAEGNEALFKAIMKFDTEKEVKFITYAFWWVRKYILEALERRVESSNKEVSYDSLGGSYTPGDFNDDDDTPSDVPRFNDLPDDGQLADEKGVDDEKKALLGRLLRVLDEREKIVIMKYFGVGEEKELGLEEISEQLHISTERVRQIKVKAINMMRNEAFDLPDASFLLG